MLSQGACIYRKKIEKKVLFSIFGGFYNFSFNHKN